MTKDQARDLHKVLRACHDGVCPKCGTTAGMQSHQFRCVNQTCTFAVSGEEMKRMEEATTIVLRTAVDTFETWKAETPRTGYDAS